MAERRIFTCDRCKATWDITKEHDPQRWTVALSFQCAPHSPEFTYTTPNLRATWCRPCVEQSGLFVSRSTTTVAEQLRTIEDVLRDIIRDEIATAKGEE